MNKWKKLVVPGAIAMTSLLFVGSSQAYVLLGHDWNYLGGSPITVDVYVNPNCADPSAPDELGSLQSALNTWSNAGANFEFNYAGQHYNVGWSYNGNNEISWDYGGGGALATTALWMSGGNIWEADIAFWDEYTWNTSWPTISQFDVETVGLHEQGHVLGLGHSQYSWAVMWYAIYGGEVQRDLSTDDIDGIIAIYGSLGGPSLTVTLTPTGSVNIPGSGGSIPYNVEIHNNVTYTLNFDGWTEFEESGGGGYYEMVIFRPDLSIGVGGNISRSLVLTIAGSVPNGTYTYYARVADYYGAPTLIDEDSFEFFKYGDDGSEPWVWETTSTGWDDAVSTAPVIPELFQVSQAYPNPFNPETTIQFDLSEATRINLAIFDMQGRKVVDLLSGEMDAGRYGVRWNAAGYPSGTYFYRLSTDLGQASGKLVLMK